MRFANVKPTHPGQVEGAGTRQPDVRQAVLRRRVDRRILSGGV